MNAKISFPDLIDLFAQKLSITKKESETFLKEFFMLSSDVISSGEQLKINGLGIFKPIWVESRTSVNVQTGQPFDIPGHYKLSFVPDKVLREAVNTPFSCFSVEIIEDDVNIPGAEMNGDKSEKDDDVENELTEDNNKTLAVDQKGSGYVKDVSAIEYKLHITGEAEKVVQQEEVPVAMLQEKAISPGVEKIPEITEDKKYIGVIKLPTPPVGEASDEDMPVEYEKEEKKRAQRRGYLIGFLSACSLLFLGIATWLFISLYCMDREIKLEIAPITFTIKNGEKNNETSLIVNTMTTDSIKAVARLKQATRVEIGDTLGGKKDSVTRTDISKPDVENVEPVLSTSAVTEETIRPGIFLTTLALKHYGHKAFWVYIYEENKSRIQNPDVIAIGTKLVIPDASKYNIDVKNKDSIDKAKELAIKIAGKNRK